jgi:hypothetical protein
MFTPRQGWMADDVTMCSIPTLPAEVVLLIVCECPIVSLPSVLCVSHDFAAASRSESLWLGLVRRRWPDFTLGDCPRLSSAREVFMALYKTKCPGVTVISSLARSTSAWPPAMVLQLDAVWQESTRRFLCGLMLGFMPTSDGWFTYHERGATPIHYRWDCLHERWFWSPDRVEHFMTSTTMLSRGVFASGGQWELAGPNQEVQCAKQPPWSPLRSPPSLLADARSLSWLRSPDYPISRDVAFCALLHPQPF